MYHHRLSNETTEPVERAVQIAGNSTFVVSLPKAWATEQGLEAGTSMYLYPHRDRLVAATGEVSSCDRSATIDVAHLEAPAVERRLESAYASGCEEIAISGLSGADPEVRRRLERAAGRLVGITIQSETEDRLTIGNVLDVAEVSLPQTVAQARQLALEMHEDAVDAVVSGDAESARQVIARDDDVDRLFAFVSRGFHRGLEDVHEIDRLGTDRTAAFRDYRSARGLERTADHAAGIAGVVPRLESPPGPSLADALERRGADARAVVDRALAGETDRAHDRAAALREGLTELEDELAERRGLEAVTCEAVIQRLRQTAEDGLEIAAAVTEAGFNDDRSTGDRSPDVA